MMFQERINLAFQKEKARREALGEPRLTKTILWQAVGATSGAATHWFNGSNGMDLDTCMKAALVLNVNPHWLFDESQPIDKEWRPALFDHNVAPASMGTRKIPLLNYVQAGVFTDIGSNFPTEDMEYLLTDLALSDRAFALQIKGESMLPEFKEGDRIIVDCDVCPRPGDFVVAKNTTEEATFKKYRLVTVDDKGQEIFELIPLNSDYPTVRSDQQHLDVIGTMVEHRKYFRR